MVGEEKRARSEEAVRCPSTRNPIIDLAWPNLTSTALAWELLPIAEAAKIWYTVLERWEATVKFK